MPGRMGVVEILWREWVVVGMVETGVGLCTCDEGGIMVIFKEIVEEICVAGWRD